MKQLFKIGCLILCVFFCFSCTKQNEETPIEEPKTIELLERLKGVVNLYQYTFEDQTDSFEEDDTEVGLTAAYIAGDNDTRICYFSYEDESSASNAYQKDRDVFKNDAQSTLIGDVQKENYQIMYSSQSYINNDVVGAKPKVLYTYSILQERYIVVIVSSDESFAKELLTTCEFEY